MEVKEIRIKRNTGLVRGDGETIESYIDRLDECLNRTEWQSEGHRLWYTHKNPYGCWICETFQIARIYADILVAEHKHERLGSERLVSEQLEENSEFYNTDDED